MLTPAHKSAILSHLFRTATMAKPTQWHVGLFLTLPIADGTGGVEVSGNGYARVQRDPSDANWLETVLGTVTNAAAITFPDPTGTWGVIPGVGLWDNTNALRHFIALTSPKTVNQDDPGPNFPAGSLQFIIP